MKMNTILKAAMAVNLLAVSGASFALTAVTPFAGYVGNVCTLAQTSSGVMVANAAGTSIGSTGNGGISVPGTVTVACNTTGTVSVANPVATGAAAITEYAAGINYGATVDLGAANKASITKGGVSSTSSIASGVYNVNAWLNKGTALPAGNYAVTVTTTLVAN